MDLPLIIKELVHIGGSVVVPGLGKFYTVRRPARMDQSRNLLIPPSQVLYFDPEAGTDDERLSGYICKKHGLKMPTAMKAVSDYASHVKNELAANGHFVISGLGNLEAGEDGILFRPSDDAAPYDGLLPSLEIPAKEKKEIQAPSKEKKERHDMSREKKEVPQPIKKEHEDVLRSEPSRVKESSRSQSGRKSIIWLPVSLLILIVGLAAVLYFTGTYQSIRSELGHPPTGDTGLAENGNRMVFGTPPASLDSQQAALSQQLDDMAAKENALAYRENASGDLAAQSLNLENETTPSSPANLPGEVSGNGITGSYHIIAGSFRVQANAEKQKAQLTQEGFQPSIIRPEDPYYMVSLDSYASLEEAAEALDRFRRQLDISLWVKKVD